MRRPRLAPPLAIGLLAAVLAATPVSAAPPTGGWAAIPSLYPLAGTVIGTTLGPDGRTYAFGSFINGGGDPTADYLAVFDPVTRDWSGLGSSGQGNGAFGATVTGVAFLGSKVIAVGDFIDVAGATNIDYFAVWNGSSWSTRSAVLGGSPFTTSIVSVDVLGSDIYVGGQFVNADGVATADRVARWNGTAWTGLVPGGATDGSLDGGVFKVDARPDGKVWVGGAFSSAGGDTTASRFAYFDTATGTWHGLREAGQAGPAIVPGPQAAVLDFEFSGGRIFVGGTFTDVSGNPAADFVAVWTGTAWTNLGTNPANSASGSGPLSAGVWSLVPYGVTMIASGSFRDAGGNANADNVAAWNGKAWLNLGVPAPTASSGQPYGTWASVNGRVYTHTGFFTSIAGLPNTAGIAQFGLPGGPTAPLSLAGAPGSGRVSLSWAAPSNSGGSPLLDYVVQYRRVGTTTWRTFADGMRTATTAVVTGLTRGVTYELRVQAVNQWAGGAFTAPIRKTAG